MIFIILPFLLLTKANINIGINHLIRETQDCLSDYYDGITEEFHNIYNSHLNKIMGYPSKYQTRRQLSEESFDETYSEEEESEEDEHFEYYHQPPLIRPVCFYGNPLLINQTQFYCNKTMVSETVYNRTVYGEEEEQEEEEVFLMEDSADTEQPGLKFESSEVKYRPEDCEIKYRLKYACLCPKDYYGRMCQFKNRPICDFEQEAQTECPKFDSFYYNSKFDGDPPCNFVDSTSVHYQINRVICYNEHQDKLNETIEYTKPFYIIWSNYTPGISDLQEDKYWKNETEPCKISCQNETQPCLQCKKVPRIDWESEEYSDEFIENEKKSYFFTPYDYYIDNPILVSYRKIEFNPSITFINWKKLSKSLREKQAFNLSEQELNGQKYFALRIDFKQAFFQEELSYQGRFTVEIDLLIDIYEQPISENSPFLLQDQDNENENESGPKVYQNLFKESYKTWLVSRRPKLFYFDDLNYEGIVLEPGMREDRRYIIVILVVLGIVILGGLICIYVYCSSIRKKRIELEVAQERQRILERNGYF